MISVRKIWTVAATEFNQAIRSKAFIIGVLLIPAIGLISVLVPKFAGDEVDKLERRVAVVDEGGESYAPVAVLVDGWNKSQVDKNGNVTGPRFLLEEAKPSAGQGADELRLALSDRVRRGEIFAFVELPTARQRSIHYYSDSPTFQALPRMINEKVVMYLVTQRVSTGRVDPKEMLDFVEQMRLKHLSLQTRGPDGRIAAAKTADQIRAFVTPLALMMLMFIIVISTASPLLNSVMEEKMTRISEVMLGSISPFELMGGKLLGAVGVSIVLSALYLSGAYGYAVYHGYGDAVTPAQIASFAVYLVLAMLIYGSLFIAIGAAATDLKDAQALMTPGMLVFMSPMFVWMPIVKAPGSTLAVVTSLIPFATPILMTLRMSLSPAPAPWQIALGFVLTLATTALFVWAGGRIFRTGILMQGKSASFSEMIRWVRAG
jgi:ABC-type Na+ efflux pump permease subunit